MTRTHILYGKMDLLKGIQNVCDAGQSMVGCMHPDERDDETQYVAAVRASLNRLVRSMSAEQVRELLCSESKRSANYRKGE